MLKRTTVMNHHQRRKIRLAAVTGASGFLGSRLVKKLVEAGIAVRAVVRDKKKIIESEFYNNFASLNQVVEADVTSQNALIDAIKGADTVFHVAAILGPAHLKLQQFRKINAEGTQNVIAACKIAGGVERFVHVSSTGALGPQKHKEIATEGTPPKPSDQYEITKLEGEEIALRESESGFPAVVARPAWIYGPADTRTLKLFRMIARKRFLVIGKAENTQHPVWIDDVVEGLFRCAEVLGIEGRVYHLAGPEIITVKELCNAVATAAGVSIWPVHPPLWLAMTPGIICEKLFSLWGGEPVIDHRKVNFFRVNRAYSIKRAKEELDWRPKMTFVEGISLTIKWYRECGRL